MDYLYIVLGVVLLVVGAESLVRGASDIALRFKISPMVVGLTVVSFGTSAPELLVSLEAALNGHPDVAIGNVVGSNLSNIGLILGLTALFFGVRISRKTLKTDYVVLLALSFLYFGLLAWNQNTDFLDGLLLFSLLLAYITWLILKNRKDNRIKAKEGHVHAEPNYSGLVSFLFFIVGLVGLRFGASFLVDGSVNLAESFGVSDRVISLTIVSIGTSLPELAASLVSAFKGQKEISLGNIIGSNIFNIGCVIGVSSMIIPLQPDSSEVLSWDMPLMLLFTLAIPLLMLLRRKMNFHILEGGLLFVGYIVYIIHLF